MDMVQEFYCNDCDDREGYFRVRLQVGYNRNVLVVCPKCGRKHPRRIVSGHIVGDGNFDPATDPYDEIHVPISAWTPHPITVAMAEARDFLRAQNRIARDKKHGIITDLKAAAKSIARHMLNFKEVRQGQVIRDSRDIIEESWYTNQLEREQEAQ
jgi:hypothetical protein